jgi:choline dehydrogenase-like flavoprotein
MNSFADTVVLGAGSAGAVIAARATERSDNEIMLLEAGPDYPERGGLPSDLVDGTRNSMRDHDWGYRHRPVPEQVAFDFPRGRVVGGSSAVNTCIALRGQPYDYDEWASLGLPEWSWQHCLPAFKRLERDLDVQNEWHGSDGPVPIRRHQAGELVPWQAAFLEACAELGFPAGYDSNDPTTTGYGPHAMNKVNGERMSAARCYLTPEVRRRPNLRLRPGVLARRVLFEGRRAVGVEVEANGVVERVGARRVIVSAGAINTPGLLLRSGVGPRAEVERLGVDLVADVPAVGARLLDHPGSAIFLVPRWGLSKVGHPIVQTVLRYRSRGSPYPQNDMQLQPGSFLPIPPVPLPLVTLACCVGKPRGHGTIRFLSADPRAKPRIDSNVLGHDEDRARAVDAMQMARAFVHTRAMRDLVTFLWPLDSVLRDRARLTTWIASSSGSGYHPSGTVPMGPDGSPDAATDGRGRVRGVEGLIVADASLMPTIPSSNTNLPTLMIGERFGAWARARELD